uniref:Uncharacterized protein n=1 Tax=Rhizophagus irregularis (strain DAOM 181602 / DAOM 197198 / MUCL 43194) TaxID=747089 RepID=U9SG40_RHIID
MIENSEYYHRQVTAYLSKSCDEIIRLAYSHFGLDNYIGMNIPKEINVPERQRRTQSWPECQTSLSFKEISTIYVIDNGSFQTDNITWPKALKHDHEEENNCRIMNKLKVLSQHQLDYNR